MGYAESRGTYWRGRYKIQAGKYGTVCDEDGTVIKFRTKRAAEQAADAREAEVRAGVARKRSPTAGRETFGSYANRWYAIQDLAASTMENYQGHIEHHLLPTFEKVALRDITEVLVQTWEKAERAASYAEASIKTWRSTLHLILADAKEEGLIDTNPAERRRGRGRRNGRSRSRGPEKVVTTALGILLIAERAALLSGRDDEFVAIVTKGFTGMRFGELVGLETQFVRSNAIRVEWQLYELDSGELLRCPPKDDSHRTVDLPDWHAELLADHIARVRPKPCRCHGLKYVFSGHGSANDAAQRSGAKLVDVAQRAGVSTGTVSNVLNRPGLVTEATRVKVELAIEQLAFFSRGATTGELAAHWRRNGFATWLFQPAASGWYPRKAPYDARPVPILSEPWPGIPTRGRGAVARADACWTAIAQGLHPHGLRHTHKTLMVELGTPPTVMDNRLGHQDGSVQARYSHITRTMRDVLMVELTRMWEAALSARRELTGRSPVVVLDQLLRS